MSDLLHFTANYWLMVRSLMWVLLVIAALTFGAAVACNRFERK